MLFKLFVGDIYEDLSKHAVAVDPHAYLLTQNNAQSFLENTTGCTAYTSVADIQDLTLFDGICCKADAIFYCPPKRWSDTDGFTSRQQQWTESVISFYTQFNKVHHTERLTDTYNFLNPDFLLDKRKADKQMWAVGCSISYGTGVDRSQTWKELVSKKLDLPYSDLTQEGSSITWHSDQILRSDVRHGDIVLWGLTAHNRMPVIDQKKLHHLTPGDYQNIKDLHRRLPIELLDNDSLHWHNVLAIRRVSNFCQKVGAKLIILGLMWDWHNLYRYYHVPEFFQLQYWPHNWVDLGSDNAHPGPKQHQIIAEKFLEIYSKGLPIE